MAIHYIEMDLRNKTTSDFMTVFDSPLGVPNSQVPLYFISFLPSLFKLWNCYEFNQFPLNEIYIGVDFLEDFSDKAVIKMVGYI